jgi:hypothetical protein
MKREQRRGDSSENASATHLRPPGREK